jgi:hypothetical protein
MAEYYEVDKNKCDYWKRFNWIRIRASGLLLTTRSSFSSCVNMRSFIKFKVLSIIILGLSSTRLLDCLVLNIEVLRVSESQKLLAKETAPHPRGPDCTLTVQLKLNSRSFVRQIELYPLLPPHQSHFTCSTNPTLSTLSRIVNYKSVYIVVSFSNGSVAPWGPRPPHFSRLHDHTL